MAIFVGNGHYFDPLPAPVISLFDTAMLRRFSSGRVRFWHCHALAVFLGPGAVLALPIRRFSSGGGRRALRLAPRTAVREKTAP